MTTPPLPEQKPNRAEFFAASLFWSLGTLIVNILPIVFQALHQGRGLSDERLGALGTAFVLGSGITSASGPFWVLRLNARWVTIGSLLVAAFGLLGVAFVADIAGQTAWWFLIGLASASMATPSFTLIGYAANPLRAYSLAFFASLVIAALASYGLPLIVLPRFGDQGVLVTIAVLFAVATPLALALSDMRRRATAAQAAPTNTSRRLAQPSGVRLALAAPLIAAVAGAIFTGVFMGAIYNFADAIAAAVGIQADAIGPIVAISLIGALAGSILPWIVGDRIDATVMIGISTAIVVLMYPVMLMSHSATAFGAAFVIHAVFGTLGYTYYLGVVRHLDMTDRIYIVFPAFQALGVAAGTSSAGFLLAHFTPVALFDLSAALAIASWFILVVAQRLSARLRRDASTLAAEAVLQH
ncbi:hypothetical protein [Cupriavidus sp. TMH.W2]|uniref:hypothetical protein n=1 Tax=Cupriavidus sp. TMH.W2 TaxID=3434465 RepID=UPI003D78317B